MLSRSRGFQESFEKKFSQVKVNHFWVPMRVWWLPGQGVSGRRAICRRRPRRSLVAIMSTAVDYGRVNMLRLPAAGLAEGVGR